MDIRDFPNSMHVEIELSEDGLEIPTGGKPNRYLEIRVTAEWLVSFSDFNRICGLAARGFGQVSSV